MLTIPFSHVIRRYKAQTGRAFPNIGRLPRAAYASNRGVTFITRNAHHVVWAQTPDGAIHELSQHTSRTEAMRAMRLLHA